jgi:type IV secretion system protein TrbD
MHDPIDTPGFAAPVRLALTQPILMAGAPRAYAILNGTIAVVIAFAGAPIAALLAGVAGHAAGIFLARHDPHVLDVLKRAMRLPGRLEP